MRIIDRIAAIPATTMQRWGREVALWVITLFLFRAFVGAGYRKLDEASGWTEAFLVWGYPDWFRRLVGVAELIGGVVIMFPRYAAYGAALIFAVMVGAVATHFRVGEYYDAYRSDLPSLCFSAALILARWPARDSTA